MQSHKIAIIGADTVGLTLAILLSKELPQYQFDLYDFDQREVSGQVTLSVRGLHALKEAGIEDVLQGAVPVEGRMVHDQRGSVEKERYGRVNEALKAVSRGSLNESLRAKIADNYPQVRTVNCCSIEKVNSEEGTISFNGEVSGAYEMIFAADDSFSRAREQVIQIALSQNKRKNLHCSVNYSQMGFVEVSIKSDDLEKNWHHLWLIQNGYITGTPSASSEFKGKLYLPVSTFEYLTHDTLSAFAKESFPQLDITFKAKADDSGSIIASQAPSVSVYPWVHGKVCLIGEAAHGEEPQFEYGVNVGLEDCAALISLLKADIDSSQDEKLIEEVCAQMQEERNNEVQIMKKMAKVYFKDIFQKISDKTSNLKKDVSAFLSQNYPDLFLSTIQLFCFTRVEYSKIAAYKPIQEEILNEVSKYPGIDAIVVSGKRVPVFEKILSKYQDRTVEVYMGTIAERITSAASQDLFKENFYDKHSLQTGEKIVYLSGHSMGLPPKEADARVREVCRQWIEERDIMTIFQNFWFPLENKIIDQFVKLVGAQSSQEIVLASSLTVNFHLLLSTFFKPHQDGRTKVITISPEFNSDVFAIQSWVDIFGLKDAIIEVPVEDTKEANDLIIQEIEKSKDQASIICMSAVNFVTGQFYDIPRIAECCKRNKVTFILQLAHAAGSVELKLHEWQVDCAVWCSYKYLNCCQGTIGGIFIHSNHQDVQPGLRGWFGAESSIYNFAPIWKKKQGAKSFQLSCADPFSTARMSASLDTIDKFGGIKSIMDKNAELYNFVYDRLLSFGADLISPREEGQHGGHMAVRFPKSMKDQVIKHMDARNIIPDYRDVNESFFVIRASFIAMYNDHADCEAFIQAVKGLILQAE